MRVEGLIQTRKKKSLIQTPLPLECEIGISRSHQGLSEFDLSK